MKKLTFCLVAVSLVAVGVAHAQQGSSTFVLPNPGITPASSFHFLENWIEGIQMFFTFNKEAKARLELDFAAERIAEIKAILASGGVNAKGLDVAKNELSDHMSQASDILENEKAAGHDVSAIAQELADRSQEERDALDNVFGEKSDAIESQIDALKNQLQDAQKAGDAPLVDSLQSQIDQLRSDRTSLEGDKQEENDAADQEVENIRAHLGAKDEATEKIQDLVEKRAELTSEAEKSDVTIPADALSEFDKLLAQAKSAFDQGDYGQAIAFADQAKEILKSSEKDLEQEQSDKEMEGEIQQNGDEDENMGSEIQQNEDENIGSETSTQMEKQGDESGGTREATSSEQSSDDGVND